MAEEAGLLQIRLKASAFAKINGLREKRGAANAEVVRNALTAYSILEDNADERGAIIIHTEQRREDDRADLEVIVRMISPTERENCQRRRGSI